MLQITCKIIIMKTIVSYYIHGNQYGNMVSAPEAASRASAGAGESLCHSCLWIVAKPFMLAKVWAEFPHVCTKIRGSFFAILALITSCWLISVNLKSDAIQSKFISTKKGRFEHTWGRGTTAFQFSRKSHMVATATATGNGGGVEGILFFASSQV